MSGAGKRILPSLQFRKVNGLMGGRNLRVMMRTCWFQSCRRKRGCFSRQQRLSGRNSKAMIRRMFFQRRRKRKGTTVARRFSVTLSLVAFPDMDEMRRAINQAIPDSSDDEPQPADTAINQAIPVSSDDEPQPADTTSAPACAASCGPAVASSTAPRAALPGSSASPGTQQDGAKASSSAHASARTTATSQSDASDPISGSEREFLAAKSHKFSLTNAEYRDTCERVLRKVKYQNEGCDQGIQIQNEVQYILGRIPNNEPGVRRKFAAISEFMHHNSQMVTQLWVACVLAEVPDGQGYHGTTRALLAKLIFNKYPSTEKLFDAYMWNQFPYAAGTGCHRCAGKRDAETYENFGEHMTNCAKFWFSLKIQQGYLAYVMQWMLKVAAAPKHPIYLKMIPTVWEQCGEPLQRQYAELFNKLAGYYLKKYAPAVMEKAAGAGEDRGQFESAANRISRMADLAYSFEWEKEDDL